MGVGSVVAVLGKLVGRSVGGLFEFVGTVRIKAGERLVLAGGGSFQGDGSGNNDVRDSAGTSPGIITARCIRGKSSAGAVRAEISGDAGLTASQIFEGFNLSVDGEVNWSQAAGIINIPKDAVIKRPAPALLRLFDRVNTRSAVLSTRAQRGWAFPNGTDLQGDGILTGLTTTQQSSSVQVTSDGAAYRQTTAVAVGQEAGWELESDLFDFEAAPFAAVTFALQQTSDARFFVGFSDQNFDVMVSDDDPAGNYIGLQVRDGEGFYWVHKDGSTLTRVDTGVAADTSQHTVRIAVHSPTSVYVELLDAAGAVEDSRTITSGLPADTAAFDLVLGVENRQVGSGRSVDTFGVDAAMRI